MPASSIIIVSDGKPGHLSQSRGLAAALGQRVPVDDVIEVEAGKAYTARWQRDALVIAAGSKAYGPALSLKRKWGCPAVALMNPGWLRRRRFDLCVVPRHDEVAESAKVIVTEGALNTVRRSEGREDPKTVPDTVLRGVVLVGGPSGHHDWDEARLLEQVGAVFAQSGPGVRWAMTSSRRTPGSTEEGLRAVAERFESVAFTPASETPQGWVAEQLTSAGTSAGTSGGASGGGGQAWVTEDSVSMVYEALTAGCGVGLLGVPRKAGKPGRVVRGIASLAERGWVTRFDDWFKAGGGPLTGAPERLDEAGRVAGIVLERLPWPAR